MAKKTVVIPISAVMTLFLYPWIFFLNAQTFTKIDSGAIVTDGVRSSGCSWGDYDNDGDLDLFVANDGKANFLYKNNDDGTFTQVTDAAISEDDGTPFRNSSSFGSSWGDYDNDGDLDLFVANWNAENNFLYLNNGNGSFTKIRDGAIVNDGAFSYANSWADYNNDGDLDLFVANGFIGQDNFLYANNGDGRFVKITSDVIASDGGESTSNSWADYDNDGDLDLFVTNELGQRNFLYQNNGDATFKKSTSGPAGLVTIDDRLTGGDSQGSSWGDYDNDGDLDLFVANQDFFSGGQNNFLYRNNGDGTFTITDGIISNDGGISIGSSWGDYDNDGDLDLFVTNTDGTNNFLYDNNGDGSFTRISNDIIVNDGGNSSGAIWGDYDNDGDLDLFVANTGNNFLYNNDGNGNKWIKINCRGTFSNTTAIGTKVKVKAVINGSSVWQLREISGQTGFGGQNSLTAAFGLADAASVDSIRIEWPSGFVWDSTNVAVNQNIKVIEQPIVRIRTGVVARDFESAGGSWGDYDNDDDLDLFAANEGPNFLYQNNGNGPFIKITGVPIVTDGGLSTSGSWGDYDNDGDLDLFVANHFQNNFLYQNDGDGTFTKILEGIVVNDGGSSFGSSWGDYDNDGDLDLFVANNFVQRNFLYQNNGDGTFIKVTDSIVNEEGNSTGGNWGDYDNDGDLDLFVANQQHDNFLYQNNGDGTFTKITDGDIVNNIGDSKGSSWGDYDNDGDLDLFVTNGFDEHNFLYQNNGDGTFTRITTGVIVNDGGDSVGSSWGDYDNDGDLDLLVTNRFGSNFFYANNGDGTFNRITAGSLFMGGASYSTSWADYNNDGNLDLFVANKGDFNYLYQNNGFDNTWINLGLKGTLSNRSGIGAKVRVKATVRGKAVWQFREISGQTGNGAQNSLNAEFGLGNATIVDSVAIEWPSGTRQLITNVQVNSFLTITEVQPVDAEHSSISATEIEKDILLTTMVTGDDISEVSINYRRGGEQTFTKTPMSDIDSDGSFQGTIPAGEVTSRGIEYFIVGADIHGNSIRLPPAGNHTVQVRSIEGISKGKTQPTGNTESGYRLISIPLDLDDKSPSAVLEDDLGKYNIKKWRYFELLPEQSYGEFPGSSEMVPGKAFWLIVKNEGKIIDTGSGISNSTAHEYAIPLHPEWNFIGNPFNFPVRVDNLRLSSGSNGESLNLRSFSGDWNEPLTNPVPRILPFDGYAIFSETNDTLLVNPNLSFPGNQLAKSWLTSTEAPWSIRILAQCQAAQDSDNILAVSSTASIGWDKFDLPEPPVIGDYVSVYFTHPEWQRLADKFCTDFRPVTTEGNIWEFEVRSNMQEKVHLTFEDINRVPPELEVWLFDDGTNFSLNLRENNNFSVASLGEAHPKNLKLLVGKSKFIHKNLQQVQEIPANFELSQNFPNPFNSATSIRYALPKKVNVTLKVFNILGEEVATIINNEPNEAGYHLAIWDGRNQAGLPVATGIYIYQISAGEFSQTQKMLLMK